ncbi:MAG: hypothetical protein DRQ61_02240 [Gammaproteobacteria bacterium]|nr:MAG: hypothetical protein DRQ56_03355 [Gammaproteobacteria bacterium]RLA24015.1 MAG: hypothetical protein DRQ61_02240 [Gammaproteobacteria bacterium]
MKLGPDEFETVKSLMSMTLFAIISDCLDIDITEINENDLMCRDLGMSQAKEYDIQQLIADIYDDLEVDFSRVTTVQSLLDQVLTDQFSPIDRVIH